MTSKTGDAYPVFFRPVGRIAGCFHSRTEGPRLKNVTRNGFTLIEVLVAVAVLSIGVVVIIQGYQTALAGLGAAREMIRASLLAAEQVADGELQALASGESAGRPLAGDGVYAGWLGETQMRVTRGDGTAGERRLAPPGALYDMDVHIWRRSATQEVFHVCSALFVPADPELQQAVAP
jgi:prepilin-type N-terminal cleavage/methylation domain-containing protein